MGVYKVLYLSVSVLSYSTYLTQIVTIFSSFFKIVSSFILSISITSNWRVSSCMQTLTSCPAQNSAADSDKRPGLNNGTEVSKGLSRVLMLMWSGISAPNATGVYAEGNLVRWSIPCQRGLVCMVPHPGWVLCSLRQWQVEVEVPCAGRGCGPTQPKRTVSQTLWQPQILWMTQYKCSMLLLFPLVTLSSFKYPVH